MKYARTSLLVVSLALIGGCVTRIEVTAAPPPDDAASLAVLGPMEPYGSTPRSFQLGAGDALGQDLFSVYLAWMDQEQGPFEYVRAY